MGTVRNFTPEVIGILAKNIDDNAGGFVDYFQDLMLKCEVLQDADLLRDIITRSNNYLRVFMEIEDKTHADVIKLLDSVQEIEDRYCAKIRAATERMRAIRVQLQAFRDIMNTTVRNDTLTTLYGAGVSLDDIVNDPEKLAQARFDAEQKGLDFPLSAAQLAASEAAYQQLLLVHSPTGIGVGGYNQLDWVNEEDAKGKKFTAAFANVACYATCMLMIAQFYGHDVTMALLVKDGFVSGSGYGNATWPFYTEDRSFGNQGETANCQKIYEELLQNRPVVVALRVGNDTHFVVATGIMKGAAPPYTYDEITVMDPMAEYTMKKEGDEPPSHYWSLADAIARKGQDVVDIRATTPGPGPDKENTQ